MIVKCQFCSKKDTDRNDMVNHPHVTEGGKKYNRYYHSECYPLWQKEKDKNDKEQAEKDRLNDIICDIHNIPKVPQQFWLSIQELRHGSVIFGKKKKRYKQGFSYNLIADTYEYCRENINYWRKNKEFKGTMNELKYCWAIINDKITVVKKKQDKKSHQQAIQKEKEVKNEQQSQQQSEVKYNNNRKKKRKDDIADFL